MAQEKGHSSNCPLLDETGSESSRSSVQIDSFYGDGLSDTTPAQKPCIKGRIYIYIFLLHIALFATSFAAVKRYGDTQVHTISSSPALESIRYETRRNYPVTEGNHSIYAGPPSLENNHAWDLLIRPTLFSAFAEEMKAAGESIQDSVELVEGGYLASTSVYHDLHCLRQLRLYIYKDIYYHNLTEPQIEYLEAHLDHCLEALRLSIMCTGDVSMYTFKWQIPPKEKPDTKTNSRRSCIVWEEFENWSRKRMVPTAPKLKIAKSAEDFAQNS